MDKRKHPSHRTLGAVRAQIGRVARDKAKAAPTSITLTSRSKGTSAFACASDTTTVAGLLESHEELFAAVAFDNEALLGLLDDPVQSSSASSVVIPAQGQRKSKRSKRRAAKAIASYAYQHISSDARHLLCFINVGIDIAFVFHHASGYICVFESPLFNCFTPRSVHGPFEETLRQQAAQSQELEAKLTKVIDRSQEKITKLEGELSDVRDELENTMGSLATLSALHEDLVDDLHGQDGWLASPRRDTTELDIIKLRHLLDRAQEVLAAAAVDRKASRGAPTATRITVAMNLIPEARRTKQVQMLLGSAPAMEMLVERGPPIRRCGNDVAHPKNTDGDRFEGPIQRRHHAGERATLALIRDAVYLNSSS
ncbi:hypothetical protein FA95DRAFT_1606559 [Auriscalpium vulgare]|uniref:Uncharacterized protein n=1 Tax=Auriscalpium vulgare TaxID=40419 RepID=A0ACB8RRV4_9AGAM|nr:hypothetical protein FA95DRAFT_1606559 [Auriscalpium vulgare]